MTNGTTHVVAGQGSGGEALLRLLAQLADYKGQITALYSTESFSGKDYSDQLRGVEHAPLQFLALMGSGGNTPRARRNPRLAPRARPPDRP